MFRSHPDAIDIGAIPRGLAFTWRCAKKRRQLCEQSFLYRVRHGRSKTVVTNPTDVDSIDLAKKPYLVVMSGHDIGKHLPMVETEMTIGRSLDSSVVVKEDNVSRLHCRLTQHNGETVIEDLGSTNGTFVNSERVNRRELNDGDLIGVGKSILKFSLQSELEVALHDEIYDRATVDDLTQLFNRKYFLKHIESEFFRARRYDRNLSLVLLDLDLFKKVNDVNGHQAGDLVLKSVGRAIKESIRNKVDVPARFGGEEFAILLPETALDLAIEIAEKIRGKVEALRLAYEGRILTMTASFGVSSNHADVASVEQLIKIADEKLYKAKHKGRNRVEA